MSKSHVMKHLSIAILLMMPAWAQEQGWIRLLNGYTLKKDVTADAYAATIQKAGGITIEFETGPTSGRWANPKNKATYAWYQEQVLNGRTVCLAMIKPGIRTVFEPAGKLGGRVGGILLVTILVDGDPRNGANFSAKTRNASDVADVLLMAVTFDPTKL
jgi:hypothetical protein